MLKLVTAGAPEDQVIPSLDEIARERGAATGLLRTWSMESTNTSRVTRRGTRKGVRSSSATAKASYGRSRWAPEPLKSVRYASMTVAKVGNSSRRICRHIC